MSCDLCEFMYIIFVSISLKLQMCKPKQFYFIKKKLKNDQIKVNKFSQFYGKQNNRDRIAIEDVA